MSNADVARGSATAPKNGAVSFANVLIFGLMNLPLLRGLALPLSQHTNFRTAGEDEGASPDDPSLWLYLSIALALVLLGGIFAGLTIAFVPLSTSPCIRLVNSNQSYGPR